MKTLDRIIGTYHFLFDRVPSGVTEVPPKPRKRNPWLKDGKPIVTRVRTGNNLRQSINQALEALGPLNAAISRGDKVMVKPNFNSDDPPPASTDPLFLRAVVEMLLEVGARVTIGESSGGVWRPTSRVFRKLQLDELARTLGVRLIAFDDKDSEWVKININGDHLRSVTVPKTAYEADRLIYLPCLKTHRLARYSGSLKLTFGFVNPGERRAFHVRFREEKLAEVNLCWQPDLIILDGRKAFISGGPNQGQIVEPKIILASGDLVAIDAEAVKVLLGYKANNRLLSDPWQLTQITTALKYKLGSGQDNYILKTL